ncbi:MAG: ABC transporter substrate-binding protein, partial [Bacteriovoracaceae bacterium]|nr:ABC transporter substrate-binding protein [Bacteriovoracaceae bacterium]
YARNTVNIDSGYADVVKAKPDAVIIIGAYRAAAAFTKKAKAEKATFLMANVSFVGTSALLKELGSDAEGVIVSQVFPSPFDNSNELVKDYQQAMTAAGEKEFDYTSLEGYVSARLVVEAYRTNKAALTSRDLFRDTMNKFNSKIGGFAISFSETNHSGSTATFLTVFKGGKVVQVSKL